MGSGSFVTRQLVDCARSAVALALLLAPSLLLAQEPAVTLAKAPDAKGSDAEKIAGWVRDLDAPEFLTRETAMAQLLSGGPAVLPALRPVLHAGSLEATSRALFVVRQLGLTANLDEQDQAGQLLAELAERKESPAIARRAAAALADLTQQRSFQAVTELEALGARVGPAEARVIIAFDENRLSIEIGDTFRGEANDLRRLKWIVNVQVITLSGKRATDAWLKQALTMPSLDEVNIYQAEITDEGLAPLAEHSGLKQLGIYYTPIGDAALVPLAKAPLLSFMKLYGTKISKSAVEKFRADSPIAVDHRKGAFLGIVNSGGDMGESCPISDVHAGSPAEKAGLMHDDIILRFKDQPVTNFSSLTGLISLCEAGDEVEIKVARRTTNDIFTVKVTLAAWEMNVAIRNARPR